MTNQFTRLALKSLIYGFGLELPLATCGYAMWGQNGYYPPYSTSVPIAILHRPAIIVLTPLMRPFALNPNDVPLPMTGVFLTQAILYSLLFLLILSTRNHRRSRT